MHVIIFILEVEASALELEFLWFIIIDLSGQANLISFLRAACLKNSKEKKLV